MIDGFHNNYQKFADVVIEDNDGPDYADATLATDSLSDADAACGCACAMCGADGLRVEPQDGGVVYVPSPSTTYLPQYVDRGVHGLQTIVRVELSEPPSPTEWPDQVVVHLKVDGQTLAGTEKTLAIPEGYAQSTIAFALPLALDPDLFPTGSYEIDFVGDATWQGQNGLEGVIWEGKTSYVVNNLIHENPIGPGWTFPFLNKLHVNMPMHVADEGLQGGVGVVRGDGSFSWYRRDGADYLVPPESLSTLSTHGDGYRLDHRDGSYDLFDSSGLMQESYDPNGNKTDFEYDGLGRLTDITDPYHRNTHYSYTYLPNSPDKQLTVTDFAGRTTVMAYASSTETMTITYPATGTIDPSPVEKVRYVGGRIASIERGPETSAQLTSLHYESASSRLSSIGRPDGSTWTLESNRQEEALPTDELVNGSHWSPAPLTENDIIDDIHQPRPSFDQFRNLAEVEDGCGNVATFQLDHRGRLLKRTDTLAGDTVIETTIERRLDIDLQGRVTRDRGEIDKVLYPDPDDLTERFDIPAPYRVNGPVDAFEASFGYDDNSNVTHQDLPSLLDTGTLRVEWSNYDERGRPQYMFDELGNTTAYEYDDAGNTTQILRSGPDVQTDLVPPPWRLWQNPWNRYDVDANGEVTTLDILTMIVYINDHGQHVLPYPDDNSGKYVDVNGDGEVSTGEDLLPLIQLINVNGVQTPVKQTRESEFLYTGDPEYIDNGGTAGVPSGLPGTETVHTRRDVNRDANEDLLTTFYTYYNDPNDLARFGRTHTVTFGHGTDDAATVRYTYDPTYGSLDLVIEQLSSDPDTYRVTDYDYDALDRLVRVTSPDPDGSYDSNGNLLNDNIDSGEPGDVNEQPTTTTYHYDIFGNVISTTVTNIDPFETSPDPTYHTTCTYYDAGNRPIWIVEPDPLNNTPANSCDVTSMPVPLAGNTASQPDEWQGRPVTGYTYDGNGNVEDVLEKADETDWRTTTYVYDALNRVVKVTEPALGDSLAIGFGERLEDGNRPYSEFVYDNVGNLTVSIDPLGNETFYLYDAWSRLTRVVGSPVSTHPLVALTDDERREILEGIEPAQWTPGLQAKLLPVTTYSYAYEPGEPGFIGWREEVTELNWFGEDRTTTTQYDYLGRVSYVALPPAESGQLVTWYEYHSDDRLLSVTTGEGQRTDYRYDERGRLESVLDPLVDDPLGGYKRPTTAYAYDDAGQQISVSDPLGRLTAYQYDTAGRLKKVTPPDPDPSDPNVSEPITTYRYDSVGNTLQVIDALGHADTYHYDWLFRRDVETDANGEDTLFTYDLVGNLETLTDPNNNETTWAYDTHDRVHTETNQLLDARTFQYDAVGNLRKLTDRNGRVTKYEYNNEYQRTKEEWYADELDESADHTMTFEYDWAGLLSSAWDDKAEYRNRYDDLGRVTAEFHNPAGLDLTVFGTHEYVALKQDYNPMGQREFLTAYLGADAEEEAGESGTPDLVNAYQYDALELMTSVSQSAAGGNAVAEKHVTFTYDLAGQLDSVTRYDDLSATQLVADSRYGYDGVGRLVGLNHRYWDAGDSEISLAAYTWQYDDGNRLRNFENGHHPAENAVYGYDDRDQLTSVTYPNAPPNDQSFYYDNNGNRDELMGYTPDADNRMESDGTYNYQYDDEGNRTRRTEIATGEVTEYEWDHRNRLVRIAVKASDQGPVTSDIVYTYDVFDRRIGKEIWTLATGITTRHFYIYDGQHILLEFAQDVSDPVLTHRYLHGPAVDQILADEQVTSPLWQGNVIWPLTDNQGTVRDIAHAADDETSIVNHITYDAFGQITHETQAAIDHLFGYTGRERDEETWDANGEGGLNYYRARYYDPATGGFIGQDPIGFDAGDANLYRYVGNSPTNATDPSGEVWNFIIGAAIGGGLDFASQVLIEGRSWNTAL